MQDQKCQEYLFDLDHFVLMKTKGQPERQPNRTVYPELPADLMEMHALNRDIHLSIDGSQCGKVQGPQIIQQTCKVAILAC